MKSVSRQEIKAFQNRVLRHYAAEGRAFPWRQTTRAYPILVSEVMLQQTQAGERTAARYRSLLRRFPTIKSLAKARLSEVLSEWQGLGYNRRAKQLRGAARAMIHNHGGRVPNTYEALLSLPGIGPYTAAAVLVFAYHKPTVMIETNIRAVYLYHFFKRSRKKINDRDILPLIEKTLYVRDPARWYHALMDYGAYLKHLGKADNRKSAHYVRQKSFTGSQREVRGAVLKLLLSRKYYKKNELLSMLSFGVKRINLALFHLEREGIIYVRGNRIAIMK